MRPRLAPALASIRREVSIASRIPFSSHVSPFVIRTKAGDYVGDTTARRQL